MCQEENYEFCLDGVLEKLKSLLRHGSKLKVSKELSILIVVYANMSDKKISPMTGTTLESLAEDLRKIMKSLESKTIPCNPNCNAVHENLRNTCKDLTHCMISLVHLQTAHAYTYNVLTKEMTTETEEKQLSKNPKKSETRMCSSSVSSLKTQECEEECEKYA